MSKGGGGTTTTTTNNAPWSGVQPYMTKGYKAAQNVLNNPLQPYPGNQVAPFSPETLTGMSMQENKALAGSPLVDAAQGNLTNTLNDKYLTPGNPYLTDLTNSLNSQVRRSVDSSFEGAGRYGSGLHDAARTEALANAVAPQLFGNYQNERSNQLKAAALTPSVDNQGYKAGDVMRNVGGTKENLAQDVINAKISNWNAQQQAPQQALSQYMNALQGGTNFGTTTSSQPYYRNRAAGALGGAMTGVGGLATLGAMAGLGPLTPFGVGVGALGGGLLGWL